MKDCIFCKIVKGEMLSYTVWESADFVAFLSIFPNTDGVTVVIPKKHYSSYVFDVPESVVSKLMEASRIVAKKIEKAFPDVARVGVVFEGYGVHHLHAKLFPLHNTKSQQGYKVVESIRDEFYQSYPGYISSHDSKRESDERLQNIADMIQREDA
jgi:diadenosine tetraphosphate (Ap4A) HIT family hydrolase